VGGEGGLELVDAAGGVGEQAHAGVDAGGVGGELGAEGALQGAEGGAEVGAAGALIGDAAGEHPRAHPAGAEDLEEVLDGSDAVADVAAGEGEGVGRAAHAVGLTSYPAKK
jgi:hypothetical protein